MSLRLINDVQAQCTLMRQYNYVLEWTPQKDYIAGTRLELRSHRMRAFITWRYIKMEMENTDMDFRWKTNPSISDRIMNPGFKILGGKLQYGIRKGEPCKIFLTVIPPMWADINNTVSIWTNNALFNDRLSEFAKEEGSEYELTVKAGSVERLSVYSRPMADIKGKVRTCIVPEDQFGNPSCFEKPVNAELIWEGNRWNQEIRETEIFYLDEPERIGRLDVSISLDELTPYNNITNGRRQGNSIIVTGNAVLKRNKKQLKAAFGEFHWHTDCSKDGQRSVPEALRCARDYLNMDFAAPGDHVTMGDNWKASVKALEDVNEPDQFATFFGWEDGSKQGHQNYYFTDPNSPMICGGEAGLPAGPPHEVKGLLEKQQGFFAVPHHTNSVAETRKLDDDTPFWHPYSWGEPIDCIKLAEIMQVRGNQERNDYTDVWRGWHQNNKSSIQDALAAGFKIGFTGGTDNHYGWPGRAYAEYEGGFSHSTKSVILTGVWTEALDRQGVYNALYNRHTWAVWDTRAIVRFCVNEGLMGDEIQVLNGGKLTAHISLSADDSLQSLEIISEGKTIWISAFSDPDLDISVPLGTAGKSSYFYLRGLQRNGGIFYGSPVFVKVKEGK